MPDDLRFDVVVQGEPARRGARVRLEGGRLVVDDREMGLDDLLGAAFRRSLGLVVTRSAALAFRGDRAALTALATELARHGERARQNVRALPELRGASLVFHSPVAARGQVGDLRVAGFPLLAVTSDGFVLWRPGAPSLSVPWPRVRRVDAEAGPVGRACRIEGAGVDLRLFYMSDAQIDTFRRWAQRGRSSPGAAAATRGGAASASPAKTTRGALPRGRAAADTGVAASAAPGAVGEPGAAAARGHAERTHRVPDLPGALGTALTAAYHGLMGAARALSAGPVRPDFMEDHVREVLGFLRRPVQRRHREAAGAASLGAAALVLDGRALWTEIERAADEIVAAVERAYESERRRIAAERDVPERAAGAAAWTPEDAEAFRDRVTRAILPVKRTCEALAEVASKVREAHALGEATDTAARLWTERLAAFDRAFADAAVAAGHGVLEAWEEVLLPRLRELATRRGGWRRWLPWG